MTGPVKCALAGLCFCAFAGMTLLSASLARADDVRPKHSATGPNQDWREALRLPGPDHERLNALIGEWRAAIRHWKSPESEAVELTGTATRRWVLDGRFVEERAENATSQGGRFQSVGYLGFNRQTKLYERFWMTSTATGIFIEKGRYDPDSNLIRTQGSEIDAASGVVILTMSELKIESPTRHILTAYATGTSGIRWKQLEITYSRK